jgi:hypothetical protein
LLAPTWTSVPIHFPRVHYLRATIQSLGTYERNISRLDLNIKGGSFYDIWMCWGGGPCLYVWASYDLLKTYLDIGPVAISPDKAMSVTVDCLELDFLDPEDVTYLPPEESIHAKHAARVKSSHAYSPHREDRLEPTRMLRPAWLAENLSSEIRSLLGMDGYFSGYGAILYEQVGKVVSKVNGEVLQEYELGKLLETLQCSEETMRRSKKHECDLEEWKAKVLRERTEKGL